MSDPKHKVQQHIGDEQENTAALNIKEGDLSHVALKGTEPKSKRSKKRAH